MFTEIGPFLFNNESLESNPFGWHKVANLLFLESPAIVGFSFNPVGVSQFNYSDESTASDNFHALESFFKKFPTLEKKPFWIAGESYAGM
jgi:carboxypeptidase C (cathepsin A)